MVLSTESPKYLRQQLIIQRLLQFVFVFLFIYLFFKDTQGEMYLFLHLLTYCIIMLLIKQFGCHLV